MVLHGDHRSFRIERAVGVAQPEHIGELQGRGAGKENFARCAEFDDGAFLRVVVWVWLAAVIRMIAAGELNRNAYRRGFGEKAGQFSDRAGLRRPRLSCGLLRQAMMTLSRFVLPRTRSAPT